MIYVSLLWSFFFIMMFSELWINVFRVYYLDVNNKNRNSRSKGFRFGSDFLVKEVFFIYYYLD